MRIVGQTTTSGVYTPSSTTSGRATATVLAGAEKASITVDGLEHVEISAMDDYILQSPNSDDVLTIDSPAGNQIRVSGASGGVSFGDLTFFNIANFTLDGGPGTDRLVAMGGVSYTLTNARLLSSVGGPIALTSIEEASLSGGEIGRAHV